MRSTRHGTRPARRRPAPRPTPRRGPRKGREDRGASQRSGRGTPPSSVILDIAFRRAYRATPKGADRFERSRRRALLKIVRSCAVAVRQVGLRLKRLTRPHLTEFEARLVDGRFGKASLGRTVARLRTAETRVRELSRSGQAGLRRLSSEEQFGEEVRRVYGKLASYLREVDADLEQAAEIARFLDDRPKLLPGVRTVVVVGFPNVGKSSLVARLSSARPEIAAYPFTTRAVAVGHTDLGFDRLQVMDTPGVLGRAGRRNPAEAESEGALETAGDVILFVLDPTETCGYTLDEQERLLARWRAEYPDRPLLEVETKSDLNGDRRTRPQVSAKSGDGLEELRARIRSALASLPPPPAPERSSDLPPEG